MAEKKKKSSTKRFGTRYGRKLKEKVADIESGHRGRHKCPYCGKNGIKRLSSGIWFCRLCEVKFASDAYSISSKMITKNIEKKSSENIKEKSSKPKEDGVENEFSKPEGVENGKI